MSYRPTPISFQAAMEPERARKALMRAFVRAGGNAVKAAAALGVARRTFDRLARRLGIEEQLTDLRLNPPKARKKRVAAPDDIFR